jgi:predicted GTPase
MRAGEVLRRFWPETLVVLTLALPWLSLIALGSVWLWQNGHTWRWAIAAAALSVTAWPLVRLVRRRANAEARHALGAFSEPSPDWNVGERQAWSDVMKIADNTEPFSFTDADPIQASAWHTIEVVARRLRPQAENAWAQFSLPEVLLLAERVAGDIRREALAHIPGIRTVRLSHVLWVKETNRQHGPLLRTGWDAGSRLWRLARGIFNPMAAVGQETTGGFWWSAFSALSYRARASATRMLIVAVGRAAIDLYSGRLVLSEEELHAAQVADTAAAAGPAAPVRIILVGQVNVGKSSLVNALARETRSAVGPVPTTARVTEYQLELEGRPAVLLVDMPGIGDDSAPDLLAQVDRADLVVWVASATQPARAPDREGLDKFRTWARAQLSRRPPALVVALTHIDELRPANEWKPPYDVANPAGPKAIAIRAAVDAVARALELEVDAIVPVAMTPGREPYNMDALWARIAIELPEAKLVQLDRLRVGAARTSLRELAGQLGNTGRVVMKAIAGANLSSG